MHEKLADTLPVFIPPYCLGKQRAHIKNHQLPTPLRLLRVDGEAVRHDYLFDALALLHLIETVVTEESMRGEAVSSRRTASLDDRLGGRDPGGRIVNHVVDEVDWSVFHVADKSHGRFHLRVLEVFLLFLGYCACIQGAANDALRFEG